MKTKHIFKSKTAIAGLITAIAGAISLGSEEVNKIIAEYAGVILIAIGALNMFLRYVTKGRVTLFPDE